MAGKGRLFQALMNAVQPALTSGATVTGLSLLGGDSLENALIYGGVDALTSGAVVGGVRALRPKPPQKIIDLKTGKSRLEPGRSRLELPLNWATSILVGGQVSKALNGDPYQVQPSDVLQSQQVLQENIQRDLLNSSLAGKFASRNAYSPGTMFQMQGLESTLPFSKAQREGMYDIGGIDIGAIGQDMGGIVGV
jgi:hypothetical protein